MNETLVIGKIVGVHGIDGTLKIIPLTDDPERFSDLDYFICENQHYDIQSVRYHKNNVLIQTKQITNRTVAERMRNKMIEINREDAVELNEGEYFIEELKGLKVYDTSSDRVGTLTDIMSAGAVDVLIFDLGEKKELMLPFLKENVSEVNMQERYMKADMSKGVLG